MTEMPDPWPLWGLELRTPRLVLRPDDDAGLLELMAEARHGVHPPEEMPFSKPWTDAPADVMVQQGLQHNWRLRAAWTPRQWTVNFLVRLEGKVIGCQEVTAKDFAVTREVGTGSWIGMRHQGKGVGTEMRAAVLLLAFDHLGAHSAMSSAYEDNVKSLGVSRKLGYQPDGTVTHARRGRAATDVRLRITPDQFRRPDWPLEVKGLEPALPMFGL